MADRVGYVVQSEFNSDECVVRQMSDRDLHADLQHLHNMIPANKPIIFQCHFRHQVIHGGAIIENCETIHDVLRQFTKAHANTLMMDPSEYLTSNISQYLHFKQDEPIPARGSDTKQFKAMLTAETPG
jgi:hypothetical protein